MAIKKTSLIEQDVGDGREAKPRLPSLSTSLRKHYLTGLKGQDNISFLSLIGAPCGLTY